VTLDRGSQIEISPEPTAEERAAIVAALEVVRAEDEREPGAWWAAGVRENVLDEDGER
jgi:hypothetical protein